MKIFKLNNLLLDIYRFLVHNLLFQWKENWKIKEKKNKTVQCATCRRRHLPTCNQFWLRISYFFNFFPLKSCYDRIFQLRPDLTANAGERNAKTCQTLRSIDEIRGQQMCFQFISWGWERKSKIRKFEVKRFSIQISDSKCFLSWSDCLNWISIGKNVRKTTCHH